MAQTTQQTPHKHGYEEALKKLQDYNEAIRVAQPFVLTTPVEKIEFFYQKIIALPQKIGKAPRVLIFGDYDVDGMASSVMMKELLKSIAKKNNFEIETRLFIPSRSDGYGCSLQQLSIFEKQYDYIILLDNGTHESFFPFIAKRGNVVNAEKIFIVDHHSNGNFKNYDFVINPNIDGTVAISTGVLVNLIGNELNKKYGILTNFVDLAALTALSDCANTNHPYIRYILGYGLELISKRSRDIFRQERFLRASKQEITPADLSFNVIPVLNAVGRMGYRPLKATELLSVRNASKLPEKQRKEYFETLHDIMIINAERKRITETVTKEALAFVYQSARHKSPLIFLYIEDLPAGLNGLVAQRVSERTGKDVFIGSLLKEGPTAGVISCSGRGKNIKKNLEILKDSIKNGEAVFSFGGHEEALGGKIMDILAFREGYEKALADEIFIGTSEEALPSGNYLTASPLMFDEFLDLCQEYSSLCNGVPFYETFYVPVYIDLKMIDMAKARNAEKSYTTIEFSFKDKKAQFLAKMDDYHHTIQHIHACEKQRQKAAFYMPITPYYFPQKLMQGERPFLSGSLIPAKGLEFSIHALGEDAQPQTRVNRTH